MRISEFPLILYEITTCQCHDLLKYWHAVVASNNPIALFCTTVRRDIWGSLLTKLKANFFFAPQHFIFAPELMRLVTNFLTLKYTPNSFINLPQFLGAKRPSTCERSDHKRERSEQQSCERSERQNSIVALCSASHIIVLYAEIWSVFTSWVGVFTSWV